MMSRSTNRIDHTVVGHSESARAELEHVLFPECLGVSVAPFPSNAEGEYVTRGR